jgi:hypothetical protein
MPEEPGQPGQPAPEQSMDPRAETAELPAVSLQRRVVDAAVYRRAAPHRAPHAPGYLPRAGQARHAGVDRALPARRV